MSLFHVPDVRWPDDIPPPPIRALLRLEKAIEEGRTIIQELQRDDELPPQLVRLLMLQNQALVDLGRLASAALAKTR